MSLNIKHSPGPVLSPNKDVPWAETMVCNPGMIKDPQSDRLHMLFRACGPWPEQTPPGCKYPPYIWVLGYAYSDDLGKTWTPDYSQPAINAPMNTTPETIQIENIYGEMVPDYANAYIEDPRFITIGDKTYVAVCTRMFPVGPYWLEDHQPWVKYYEPDWSGEKDNPFGMGAKNCGNVLYEVDMDKLAKRDYKQAFKVVSHLTNPELGENRDVFPFPEKFKLFDKEQYLLIHRPNEPSCYNNIVKKAIKPSVFLSAAENFKDFPTTRAKQHILFSPRFSWEEYKVGGSFTPIRISENEWLLSYHGTAPKIGYTQSFIIVRERDNDFPEVTHRCPERMMYASEDWEQPKLFGLPCLFTTAGVVVDGNLIMGYGAADQYIGTASVKLSDLTDYIRNFDKDGR